MRTWTKRDWTPSRRGAVYCSPACGGKCTWAAYQKAKKRSDELAAQLGFGWKGEVWENLGWHFKVTYRLPDGWLNIRENHNIPKYTCYLNADGAQFIESSDNIQESVRRCVRVAYKHLQWIGGLIASAHGVVTNLRKD